LKIPWIRASKGDGANGESGCGKVRQECGLCRAGGVDILIAKIDPERGWLYGRL